MADRQLILDGLQVDLIDAIDLTEIPPMKYGKKTISSITLKRLLQYVAGFKSRCVWYSNETIGKVLQLNEGTVRRGFHALAELGLIHENRKQKPHKRTLNVEEVIRRIPSSTSMNEPEQTPAPLEIANPQAMQPAKATGPDHVGIAAGRGRSTRAEMPGSCGQSQAKCPDHAGAVAVAAGNNRPEMVEQHEPPQPLKPGQSQPSAFDLIDGKEVAMPTSWSDADRQRVKRELSAAGVRAVDRVLCETQNRGVSPDAVLDALFVALKHVDPNTKRVLGQAAFVVWATDGKWVNANVPTAAELRATIESNARTAQTIRTQEREQAANLLRMKTIREARKRSPQPPQWVTLAIIAKRLIVAGLGDCTTHDERAALIKLQTAKAGSPRSVAAGDGPIPTAERSPGDATELPRDAIATAADHDAHGPDARAGSPRSVAAGDGPIPTAERSPGDATELPRDAIATAADHDAHGPDARAGSPRSVAAGDGPIPTAERSPGDALELPRDAIATGTDHDAHGPDDRTGRPRSVAVGVGPLTTAGRSPSDALEMPRDAIATAADHVDHGPDNGAGSPRSAAFGDGPIPPAGRCPGDAIELPRDAIPTAADHDDHGPDGRTGSPRSVAVGDGPIPPAGRCPSDATELPRDAIPTAADHDAHGPDDGAGSPRSAAVGDGPIPPAGRCPGDAIELPRDAIATAADHDAHGPDDRTGRPRSVAAGVGPLTTAGRCPGDAIDLPRDAIPTAADHDAHGPDDRTGRKPQRRTRNRGKPRPIRELLLSDRLARC